MRKEMASKNGTHNIAERCMSLQCWLNTWKIRAKSDYAECGASSYVNLGITSLADLSSS